MASCAAPNGTNEKGETPFESSTDTSGSKLASENESPSPCSSPPPYTLLSSPQRTTIALIAGIAALCSPLTANIYLPCLPLLQDEFDTTVQLMNLTITGYVVIQGIAPSFFSQLSESLGRRPVYLMTFTLFVAASLGLAANPRTEYSVLLALRMVQSFGSSVSTSIAYAVVADIAAPSERGRIIAPVMMMLNLGPVIAPVIGGPLCDHAGWRWIFWFLAIFGSVFLTCMLLLLPETNRKLVGNGSGITATQMGISRPFIPFLTPKVEAGNDSATSNFVRKKYPNRRAKAAAYTPNPFKAVLILFHKDSACVFSASAIFYMMYYVSQASLPPLFREAYGFNETQIGLSYLALGSGVFFGSQLQAKVMDWNYRTTARSIGWEINTVAGDDLSKFPIERARAKLSWVFHALQCSFVLAYGWAIHVQAHPAVPITLQFFQGLSGWVQSWNTLSVEIHRDSPSTASAAGNLTRCALSAGAVAMMEPLMAAIGIGPFFTLLAGSCATVGISLSFIIRYRGMEWRLAREKVRIERRQLRTQSA